MPVHTSEKDGIILVRCWGEHSSEELREAGLAATEGSSAADKAHILVDVSESDSIRSRETSTLIESARIFAERTDVIAKAAIVAPDNLLFGLMRMAASFGESSGLNTQAFRTAEAAEAWLRQET